MIRPARRGALAALVVPLVVLCGGPVPDARSDTVVHLGEWRIRDGRLSTGADPWWEGEATAPGDRYVDVWVLSKPLPSTWPHQGREFGVPDLGTVHAEVATGWPDHTPGPKYRAWMSLTVPAGSVIL